VLSNQENAKIMFVQKLFELIDLTFGSKTRVPTIPKKTKFFTNSQNEHRNISSLVEK